MVNVEKQLIRKYFKIKNPDEPGILKVVDLEDAVEIFENAIKEQNATKNNILLWAEQKGIFEHGSVITQFHKLIEVVLELNVELRKLNDREAILNEFGDVLVVLTILAKQLDTDFETCLKLAYEKISKRTGKMENGTFVKD